MLNKTSAALALITIFQLAIGLFLQLYIIKTLEVGELTDAFIAAQTIPAILSAILIAVFQSVYLPSLSVKVNFPKRWHIEASKAHTKLLIIFVLIGAVLVLLSKLWIATVFRGFNDQQIETTQVLFFFLIVSSWLSTHNYIAAVSLRTVNKFILADSIILIGGMINVAIIYLYLDSKNIYILGLSFVISSFIVSVLLYRISKKPKLILRDIFSNNKNWTMMIPLIKGNILYKTSPLLDRFWLAQSFNGAMTIYSLANLINSSIIKIADKLFVVMHLSQISNLVKQNRFEELKKLHKMLFIKISLFTFIIGILLFAIEPFLSTIMQNLFNLSKEHTYTLWMIILIFLGVLFASLSSTVINNIFYSLGDTKTPSTIGIYGFLISIPLRSLGFIYGGLVGLAIMNSVYYLGNLFVLGLKLKERFK